MERARARARACARARARVRVRVHERMQLVFFLILAYGWFATSAHDGKVECWPSFRGVVCRASVHRPAVHDNHRAARHGQSNERRSLEHLRLRSF